MNDWHKSYTIYSNPKDFPRGSFVVRGWAVDKGEVKVDEDALAVTKTLEEARKAIPSGLFRFPRVPGDDPVIVEVWL